MHLEEFRKIIKGKINLFEAKLKNYNVKLYLYKNEYVPEYRLIFEASSSEMKNPIQIDLPNGNWIDIDRNNNIKVTLFIDKDEMIKIIKTLKNQNIK